MLHWPRGARPSVSAVVLPSVTGCSLALLVTVLCCRPLARDPSLSLPKFSQLSQPVPPSLQARSCGAQQPAGWLPSLPYFPKPALPVISVPRAQSQGSRREGWLPGQRRIKPLLCQASDWLRQVPPPANLRVRGRRKGLRWAGRGTRPAQDCPLLAQ